MSLINLLTERENTLRNQEYQRFVDRLQAFLAAGNVDMDLLDIQDVERDNFGYRATVDGHRIRFAGGGINSWEVLVHGEGNFLTDWVPLTAENLRRANATH